MNARPHPGPLPQERENSAPRPAGSFVPGLSARQTADGTETANATATKEFLRDVDSFSLSPGERAGVRADVKPKLCFSLAASDDDADIRWLLRENPMPGKISLTFEREPDYFADANLADEMKQTIVARLNGRIFCVGNCTIRRRFVNGQPQRVGYLGGLRLDACVAGRADILRRGYEFFHELQSAAPADFYFTSIAADNERARSFLERGLRGFPRYEFIGEFVTVLLPAERRPVGVQASACSGSGSKLKLELQRAGSETGAPPAVEFTARLNEHNRRFQFAPCWSAEDLSALPPLGLDWENFQFVHDGKDIAASAALWDQRSFKQTVVRGYAPWLARVRPALNLFAHFTDRIQLPAIGETLANAFVSHLAVEPGKPDALVTLLAKLRGVAAQRNIELLTLGFVANDPRLGVVRKHFRGREYRSRLYVVRWPGGGGAAGELDGKILAPEAALL